jgi:hypothetical protein
MNPRKNIIIAATLSAILSVASLGAVQAADGVETMKPLQGVSFHAGTKHAAGYFLKDNNTCKLVLTMADEGNFAPTRFESAIETGRSTRYQFAEGKSLEFACQADGQELAVTSFETTVAN